MRIGTSNYGANDSESYGDQRHVVPNDSSEYPAVSRRIQIYAVTDKKLDRNLPAITEDFRLVSINGDVGLLRTRILKVRFFFRDPMFYFLPELAKSAISSFVVRLQIIVIR